MKHVAKIITLGVAAVAAPAAHAQLYGELGYSALTLKDTSSGSAVEASPNVLGATIGYDTLKNLAVEGIYLKSLNDDAVKFNSTATGVTLKVDNAYGVFLKPKALLGESLELFGRLGYMKTNMTLIGNGSGSLVNDGLAYGVGANYHCGKSAYLTASYLSLYDKDGTKLDGFSLGLGVKF